MSAAGRREYVEFSAITPTRRESRENASRENDKAFNSEGKRQRDA